MARKVNLYTRFQANIRLDSAKVILKTMFEQAKAVENKFHITVVTSLDARQRALEQEPLLDTLEEAEARLVHAYSLLKKENKGHGFVHIKMFY